MKNKKVPEYRYWGLKPSIEYFNIQTEHYKKQIMGETNYKISIEAAITEPWKKFIGENGLCFGVDDFGKSAPGKDVFKSFFLDANFASS